MFLAHLLLKILSGLVNYACKGWLHCESKSICDAEHICYLTHLLLGTIVIGHICYWAHLLFNTFVIGHICFWHNFVWICCIHCESESISDAWAHLLNFLPPQLNMTFKRHDAVHIQFIFTSDSAVSYLW